MALARLRLFVSRQPNRRQYRSILSAKFRQPILPLPWLDLCFLSSSCLPPSAGFRRWAPLGSQFSNAANQLLVAATCWLNMATATLSSFSGSLLTLIYQPSPPTHPGSCCFQPGVLARHGGHKPKLALPHHGQ